MKLAVLFTMLVAGGTVQASLEVRTCAEDKLGLQSLVVPVSKNSVSFGNKTVNVYLVDRIEPAGQSAGLAFVMPDLLSEIGEPKCLSIVGMNGVDLQKVLSRYSPREGLVLSFPKSDFDDITGGSKAGNNLVVRIDIEASTLEILSQ